MVNFNYFKENLWLSALIGGVVSLIALFTPAWSYSSLLTEAAVVWLWNMTYYINDGLGVINGQIVFIPTEEAIFSLGIICTLILIIGAVILLVPAILGKRKSVRIFNILWIIGGILSIICPIIYLVGSVVYYSDFWTYYIISAGLILPFIAGAFGLFAGITGILKQRE
ncbi:MAG: hypothetical protein ACFFEO_17415 [Candidatus Thorarchaeota archaeon]